MSHVALQPNMAVVVQRCGEELRGRHVAKVTASNNAAFDSQTCGRFKGCALCWGHKSVYVVLTG